MPTFTLSVCPNPECPTWETGQVLPDVAGWCPHCDTYEVARVPVELAEAQIAAGERRRTRPLASKRGVDT